MLRHDAIAVVEAVASVGTHGEDGAVATIRHSYG